MSGEKMVSDPLPLPAVLLTGLRLYGKQFKKIFLLGLIWLLPVYVLIDVVMLFSPALAYLLYLLMALGCGATSYYLVNILLGKEVSLKETAGVVLLKKWVLVRANFIYILLVLIGLVLL